MLWGVHTQVCCRAWCFGYAWEVCFLIHQSSSSECLEFYLFLFQLFNCCCCWKNKCLSVCLSVYQSVCLCFHGLLSLLHLYFEQLSVCTSVCQPVCTGVSAYPVYLPLLAYLTYIQMSLYNHDFSPIWNHDLGGIGICGICVQLCWWDYWWQKLYILLTYPKMPSMYLKYLVDIRCTFWGEAILLKFFKWLSCLYH